MGILELAILAFIIMESLNVAILYFWPNSRKGNGVAVFDDWHESQKDPRLGLFTRYLAYWVAGCKLIFIVLLAVVLAVGNTPTKVWAVVAMILSIASYYWKLGPIIRKLDRMGAITPKGYARVLDGLIAGFLLMFTVALLVYLR